MRTMKPNKRDGQGRRRSPSRDVIDVEEEFRRYVVPARRILSIPSSVQVANENQANLLRHEVKSPEPQPQPQTSSQVPNALTTTTTTTISSSTTPTTTTPTTTPTKQEMPCCSKNVSWRIPSGDYQEPPITSEEISAVGDLFADAILADLDALGDSDGELEYPEEPLNNPKYLEEQIKKGYSDFPKGSEEQKEFFKLLQMRLDLMPLEEDEIDDAEWAEEEAKRKMMKMKQKKEDEANALKFLEGLGGLAIEEEEGRSSVISSVDFMGSPSPPESDDELDFYHSNFEDFDFELDEVD